MTITTDDPVTTDTTAPSAESSSAIPSGPAHWTGAPADSPWLAAARQIAPELAAVAAEHDRTGEFVAANFELVKRHRLPSMLVPADLGGGGATYAEACAVLAELAAGCPSTALALSMHQHLIAAQVWRHRRGLPAPVLEKVAAGQLILVSTGAADWMASSGTATPVDGGFRISGRKSPASGAPAGDVVVTSVRFDGAAGGPEVLHLSVPFTAPGVKVQSTWDTMGMRATGSETIVLDDVFVPEAAIALARPADRWHPVWATVLGVAMPLIMSTYAGVAADAATRALDLAQARAHRPTTATMAGRLVNRLTATTDAVRAMIDAADDLEFDNTLAHAASTLARKANATEAVLDTVRLALEVGGGAAFSRSSAIERLFRDAHGALYHPLPPVEQEQFTGRVALGLDPVEGA
jgi:alkylation response protein AidB-like acyl-CoA dehydrogenase